MDCALTSLHALIACFSWSGLYIDTGLSYQDAGLPYQEWRTYESRTPSGAIETRTQLETHDDPFNPYGWAAIGFQVELRNVTIELEARHAVSSLRDDNDRGIN